MTDLEGNPWFIAKDVCEALHLGSTWAAAKFLDEDEKGACIVSTPGGPQSVTLINESGLYSLILRSRKPEAKRFKKWITSEVLPALRKTGGYVIAQAEDTPEIIMARGMLAAGAAIERLKLQIAEQGAELETARPKAAAFEDIADSSGLITFRAAAGVLGVPQNKFMSALERLGIIYRTKDSKRRPLGFAPQLRRGHIVNKVVNERVGWDGQRVEDGWRALHRKVRPT